MYFIIIDILAMGCLYKNFFKRTILNEVNEVFGTDPVCSEIAAGDVSTLHEQELSLSDEESVAEVDQTLLVG